MAKGITDSARSLKLTARIAVTPGVLERRLPSPPFFRCHQSFVVNLRHVRELRSRGGRDHELKLAPPVNKVIPIARSRLAGFRRAIEGRP